jgi:hypothetical protein
VGITKEVIGHQTNTEKLRQQRKPPKSSKPIPGYPEDKGKPKMHLQARPDGPRDRLAILAAG